MAGRPDAGARWSAVVVGTGEGGRQAAEGRPYCISDEGACSYIINVYKVGIRVRRLEPNT